MYKIFHINKRRTSHSAFFARNKPYYFKFIFDYYYGNEAEQFSFLRVPKFLFTHKTFISMSCDAKILYSLMLDRMSLSVKNCWLDEENRVYIIFTQYEARKFSPHIFLPDNGYQTVFHKYGDFGERTYIVYPHLATAKSAKCDLYYTPETDGLTQSWNRGGAVFCNPPYGRKHSIHILHFFRVYVFRCK